MAIKQKKKMGDGEMTQEEIKKVDRKIPKWFRKNRQINSRILIKFLELSNKDINLISKEKLKETCSDIFAGNYDQMKNVGEKNNAQVFYENNDGDISLQHDEVRKLILEEYEKFLSSNNENNIEDSQKSIKKLINTKNIILYGVAGVGKTYNTDKIIRLIEDKKSNKEIFKTIKDNTLSDSIDISDIKERVKFITFHQSFGYEDFIEGFRPNEEGKIVLVDGIFKEICKEATEEKEKNYYLIIDEINRGNISKIFGELITLIEESKRDNLEVILPYSKEPFKIPSNLYIIGTMNSSDKSIALIDIALRRRFTFLKMKPKAELVPESLQELFIELNEYISNTLGDDYLIGHSYFMNIDDLDFVLEYKIKPLLEEYFYGDSEGLKTALKIIDNNR
jgi:5-methylcytosine-specific restriction endonuclease McrBC GTP-binding regulatory subunit McrB